MLGVGDVATLGVRDVREAVADVFLVALGDAWGYLTQRVDRVRVKDETDLFAALPQSVRDRFGDEDLAQVAGVDVTRDAGPAHAVLQLGSVVGTLEKRDAHSRRPSWPPRR